VRELADTRRIERFMQALGESVDVEGRVLTERITSREFG
jgi:hypothetical protein